jgi:eukaryotic-like serine/threonine-protein kinase
LGDGAARIVTPGRTSGIFPVETQLGLAEEEDGMGACPERIGPYRIDARLGSGGMGEVYRAWDERLDRWVAIKVIRPGVESATARERFRREARAAAALSHPAVVQIFDILEWSGGDAIVMELVAGESLAARISRGPVPLAEALRIGGDVASGLAAAHSLGILHRDLKPENVMICPEGSAKILDFGLSKRLGADASITEDDRVLGTFRCMSPEQVRNLPLDHRSDLFSLGTFLYETLSGRSPFEGGSILETLDRICNHRQTPLRQVALAVPVELSDLVDDLLQKDPMRRPRSAREVVHRLETLAAGAPPSRIDEDTWGGERTAAWSAPAAKPQAPSTSYSVGRPKLRSALVLTLLASLAALLLLWRGEPQPVSGPSKEQAAKKQEVPVRPERIYVAVTRPEVGTGGAESSEILTSGLRIALLRSLLSLEGLSTYPPEQVDEVLGSPVRIARALAADEVMASRLDCRGEVCQISLSRIAGDDGRLLWTQSFSAAADRPYSLAETVQGYLAQGYPGYPVRVGSQPLEVRPEDYAEYLRLRQDFESKHDRRFSQEELLTHLETIRASSPQFLEAYVFESDVRQQRFKSRRDPADLAEARALLSRARSLAPTDPRPLFAEFGIASVGGDLDRAEEVLAELDRLQPGDPGLMVRRARLVEARDPAGALSLIREGTRRQPSWKNLFWLADMELRQGYPTEARRDVAELLRRFPEKYEGLSLLAQIEVLYGSLHRAVDIYSRLAERSPRPNELTNLGFAYLYLKDYVQAERVFREVLDAEPKNPFSLLNLADALFLQGRSEAATPLYRGVLDATEAESDSVDWQVLSARAQARARLGEVPGAIEAVQKMLRIAPEGPQPAFDAALIYSLLGDRASARFNAQKALEQGLQSRLFDHPVFETLRADPAFRSALERRAGRS